VRGVEVRLVPYADQHPQMVLLLQSSTPIISREGSLLLSRYFDQHSNMDVNDSAYQLDKVDIHRAETLLRVVHDVIDKVTNCPKRSVRLGDN
jgi:hypothetical protein